MDHEAQRYARKVTHVLGGFFYLGQRGRIALCVVLPQAAVRAGQHNLTLPGGGINRRGRSRFEPVDAAMEREGCEEFGLDLNCLKLLSGVGGPVNHLTDAGLVKKVQLFAGVTTSKNTSPLWPHEIHEVYWVEPNRWASALRLMHPHKRQLVLQLLQGAATLSRMYPCVSRVIKSQLPSLRAVVAA